MYSWACPHCYPPKCPMAIIPWDEKLLQKNKCQRVCLCHCWPIPAPISAQWLWLLFPYFHPPLSPICHCALAAWRFPVTWDWQQTAGFARGNNNRSNQQNNTKISIHKQIWCCSLQRSIPFNITFHLSLITPHMFCKQNNRDHLDNLLMSKRACWHPFGEKCPSAA